MSQPKISGSEIYYLLAFALIGDILNWIPVFGWIITIITLAGFQFYFIIIKGVKSYWSLGGNLAEFIPFLNFLPALTLGVVITILKDRAAASKSTEGVSGKSGPNKLLKGGGKPETRGEELEPEEEQLAA